MKKALLFGASGFVGSYLLQELLKHPAYEQVTIVVRRPLDISHPKLKMLIGDLATLHSLKEQLVGDEVFIALGTTQKHTPNRQEYYRIDHDYPVLAAKLAKENGARSVFLVSAVGADPHSNFFYVKTKGDTERDMLALGFEHTHLFQPSMILGERKEKRPLEKTLIAVWSALNPLFAGPISRYRGIDAKDIAGAMMEAAQKPAAKSKTYRWSEMTSLLES